MQNFFYHENNLNNKINTNYRDNGSLVQEWKESEYDSYKHKQLEITGIDEDAIKNKVTLLSDYYNNFDNFNREHGNGTNDFMTSQSKARSTILEEFCGFLFKDLPIMDELNLNFFNKNIYSGLTIRGSNEIIIKTKDVDFCVGKPVKYNFVIDESEQPGEIVIPLVGIECKTYLDKTMFSEAQFSAQKIKQGSPDAKVYVLSHTNAVKESEIPFKGETPINQIFLIQNKETKEFSWEATFEFFNEVNTAVEMFKDASQINKVGKLLREF